MNQARVGPGANAVGKPAVWKPPSQQSQQPQHSPIYQQPNHYDQSTTSTFAVPASPRTPASSGITGYNQPIQPQVFNYPTMQQHQQPQNHYQPSSYSSQADFQPQHRQQAQFQATQALPVTYQPSPQPQIYSNNYPNSQSLQFQQPQYQPSSINVGGGSSNPPMSPNSLLMMNTSASSPRMMPSPQSMMQQQQPMSPPPAPSGPPPPPAPPLPTSFNSVNNYRATGGSNSATNNNINNSPSSMVCQHDN